MLLFIVAYLGGALTIVSPCILPVLPFVFARADRPFARSTLPMLAGMALTFAGVATLAAVGGGWAVAANRYGRLAALAVLALFGVTLLFPLIAARLTQPIVALGGRLSQAADRRQASVVPSLLIGVATGLLWAPCAGPILGLVLTGAALSGASARTSLLLASYAAGAATALALALLVGGRLFAAMKRSLHAGEWIRRALGVAVLAGVAAIALGADTGALTRLSLSSTSAIEQRLLDRLHVAARPPAAPPASNAATLPIEGRMPSLAGAVAWLNSPPLSADQLRGKVVLVDFWTYSCINCLRSVPYVEAWAEKYRAQGLVAIGVHAPEFAFEKDLDNVKRAVADLHLSYPIAVDNDYAIWRGFNNQYWPAHYFVDVNGNIRHHHFGEGAYDESERVIQTLLAEAGHAASTSLVSVRATGAQAAPAMGDLQSPETYVGYDRAERFVSPGGQTHDRARAYAAPAAFALNEWALTGRWTIGDERARLDQADGGVIFHFHARDLHLVLGPGASHAPIPFTITIDGRAPGDSHGVDVTADGHGVVTEQRLYQLVRQPGSIADHTFEIRFHVPGVEAFAFTFG